jgi:mono/diheme cytochrome c family protein
MRPWIIAGAAILCLGGALVVAERAHDRGMADADVSVGRGRYLVQIGGCNDCHTPDYMAKAGDVPEDRWLVGTSLGFNGPWGTTYPTNLRRLLRTMDEDSWVRHARTLETRPPMPWFNLRAMSEDDLRAMHRYVRSLPADNAPVPDYVPPDQPPRTPYIVMVPQTPKP